MHLEEFRETVEELTEEYEEEDPDNLCNDDWQGTVTEVESLDEEKWNKRLIGAVTVEGLNFPEFYQSEDSEESEGKARRLGVAGTTRLQRLVDGETPPIDFHEIRVGSKIAIAGGLGFTELTTPPTIYSEVIALLEDHAGD